MPRRPRVSLPGIAHHIIQRGNNRCACFYGEEDYRLYLEWLSEYAEEAGCQLHAYMLMTNHVHLLITPDTAQSAGHLMKRLGQRYVQYINRTYRRTGTLWEGRFRSCLVKEENYVLGCYRYIELNPVRAMMVDHPAEYPWSSYRTNAQGEVSDFIKPHSVYQSLGLTADDRVSAYRQLFCDRLDSRLVNEIRQATKGNYALGSEGFKKEVEAALGRRASPGLPGRPCQRE